MKEVAKIALISAVVTLAVIAFKNRVQLPFIDPAPAGSH